MQQTMKMQNQQIRKRDKQTSIESTKQTSMASKQRKGSMKRSKQACYQTNKQERVSSKDKCGFGFDIHRSTRSEYGRHVYHQAKFLKGTWDLMYKDECEPARDCG